MYTEEQKQQIRRWWQVFHRGSGFTEIRILGNSTYSGMYADVENLIADLDKYGDNGSAYFVINDLDSACYEKSQKEKMMSADFRGNKKLTTSSDTDIRRWSYVYIDVDSKRATDVNANATEKEYAHRKAIAIYKYLQSCGFGEMIVADSANGYHIFVPCDFASNDENNALVKRFIYALGVMFSDNTVDIDLKVFNPSRIAKLPGSYSFKGAENSVDRPRRMCHILIEPNEWIPNAKAYFVKVAEQYPEEKVIGTKYNNYSSQKFDLPAFIEKYGIQVRKVEQVADGTRYILDHCLFNPDHKGRDAMLFQHREGAIAYFCFHSSCASYKWRDVRLLYEPDAYTKKDYDEFLDRREYNSGVAKPVPQLLEETADKGAKWLKPSSIKYHNPADDVHIPSGLREIDAYMGGWCLPDTTVLTGLPASGKTSIINTFILTAIQHGYKCACWSGELIPSRFMSWILQAAAGLQYVKKREGYEDWYYTPQNVAEKISKWMDDKFYLYNNDYGNNESQLFADIEKAASEHGVQLFILDNLAAMTLDGTGDKLEKQIDFINRLNEITKRTMTHCIVVIHPRKESGNNLVRMDSIGGARELYGLASNAIIVHRNNEDFKKRASEFFGHAKVSELEPYDGIVEVTKNREQGQMDKVFGLFYESKTRRYKNNQAEYVHYAWEDEMPYIKPLYYDNMDNNDDLGELPWD